MAAIQQKKLSDLHLAILDVLYLSDDNGMTHSEIESAARLVAAKDDPKLAKAPVLSAIGELCLPAPVALVHKVMDEKTGEPIGGTYTPAHRFALTEIAREQIPTLYKTYGRKMPAPKQGVKPTKPDGAKVEQTGLHATA